jgi:hypothetical protein
MGPYRGMKLSNLGPSILYPPCTILD